MKKIILLGAAAAFAAVGFFSTRANSMPEHEPYPCETGHPNHLCNKTFNPPTGVICPENAPHLDLICLEACKQAFQDTVTAAQMTACSQITAACNQRTSDIETCDNELAECLSDPENDAELCAGRHAQCYQQAFNVFEAAMSSANSGFDYALQKANQAFLKCAANCCVEEDN